MKPGWIPLATLAKFAHQGQVYRSFGYFLAARNGSLLAVPIPLVSGDFSGVRDGCPVSWYEVFVAVDSPVSVFSEVLQPNQLLAAAPLLAALFPPYGWVQDHVAVSLGGTTVPRVRSPDGVIFCWVPPQDKEN